mmetsp:Transcript_98079/g.280655  ORF Transcript_98079/g.280655 Transcript_98079/m.280655 type:complete len:202 (+) Transcript_98079:1510-2115(+)
MYRQSSRVTTISVELKRGRCLRMCSARSSSAWPTTEEAGESSSSCLADSIARRSADSTSRIGRRSRVPCSSSARANSASRQFRSALPITAGLPERSASTSAAATPPLAAERSCSSAAYSNATVTRAVLPGMHAASPEASAPALLLPPPLWRRPSRTRASASMPTFRSRSCVRRSSSRCRVFAPLVRAILAWQSGHEVTCSA